MSNINNTPPSGNPTATLSSGKQNTAYIFTSADLLQGFNDVDSDTLIVLSVSADNGELTFENDKWTFVPDVSFSGAVTLDYVVSDNFGGEISATQTFTLVPPISTNHAPTGSPTVILTNGKQNTVYTFTSADLLQGFSDVDGDILSVLSVSSDNGELAFVSDKWTFTPDVNFSGTVNLDYVVVDNLGGEITATQTFTLVPPVSTNHAPTGSPTATLANGKQNTAYTFTSADLLQGFSDVDGDTLSILSVSSDNGELAFASDKWTFTPDVNFSGTVNLDYVVSDNLGGETSGVSSFNMMPTQSATNGTVTIVGVAKQNQMLSANNTLSDTSGLGTITYQWLSDNVVILGENKSEYTLKQVDVGKSISVKASYTDGLGKLKSITSSPTALVANVNDLPIGTVTLTGIPVQGQILSVSNNLTDADGLGTIIYQWLRDNNVISNATNSSYTLTALDVGKSISVKANYIDALGTAESVSSNSILIPASNQLSVNSPMINEGDTGQTNLIFNLTLPQSTQQNGSLDYVFKSGTAVAGTDFSATSGTVQFKVGDTSKTIIVPILGDTNIENDETLNLVLSNPINIEFSGNSSTLTGVGTIRNDDFPLLTVTNNQSIQEGNSGKTSFTFPVKLSEVALSDVSVDYVIQGGTATPEQDFITQTGTLKFATGESEKTISVDIIGDTTEESDETFTLTINNPKNVKFADSASVLRSIGTILNDDGQNIRLSSPIMTERDSGIGYMKFVLSIDYAVATDVSFDYKTQDGTATSEMDYINSLGSIKIPAGSKSAEILIPVIGDTLVEPDENFSLILSNPKGLTLSGKLSNLISVGTIQNDDLPIITLLSSKTVYEPSAGSKRWDIPLAFSTQIPKDVIVSYHTESGTATEDADFLKSNNQITLSAGSNSGVIPIYILADSEKEIDETFKLIIDKVEGAAKLSVGQSKLNSDITISGNSVPTLAIQSAVLREGDTGNSNLVFKVNLSSVSTLPITFTIKTSDKTATTGLDYLAITPVIKTIPAGNQSMDIIVPIVGDKIPEGDESFGLELSKISNAVFDNGSEVITVDGTIIDDDKPVIRIEDAHVLEGNQGFHDEKIKITLSMPAATPVSLHYKLLDGTAKAGEDFVGKEDDLIIPAGAKEGYISVSIQGDTTPEAAQDFHIQLSNLVNAQFYNLAPLVQNTVTIDSDDGDSLPVVSINKNLSIDEGDLGLTKFPITLTLSKPATDILTIQYQTIGIDAKKNSDFIDVTGEISFLSGESSQTIYLDVYGDTEVESDEDFSLLLSAPQGLRLANNQATQEVSLLIRDDDAEPPQILQGTAKNDVLDATKAGGTGDDTLDGLKGIDTMIGGDGNDTYFVDNVKDSIVEGDQSQSNAGDDDLVHSVAASYILPANVEHLIIDGKLKGNGTGNVLDNKLTGNLAVNILSGLAGDDTLDGGSGNDTLTGGDGNDTFIFSQGIKGNKNIDTIKDFVHGQDKIYLSADIFSKLATAVGFVSDSEPMSLAKADSHYLVSAAKVKAVDVNSYLLYDTKTGLLAYDEDGSGKLVASTFVTLTGKPTLTLDDFWIY